MLNLLRKLIALLIVVPCFLVETSPAQEAPLNAYLTGHWNAPAEVADIWGDGDYAYVGYFDDARVSILDISEPSAPTLVATYYVPPPNDGSRAFDIKVADGLMFIALEYVGVHGAQIVDVRDPTNPQFLANIAVFNAVHNLFYDNGYLYLAPGNFLFSPTLKIIDLTNFDPDNPPPSPITTVKWSINVGFDLVHDITVLNGRAYVAAFDSGIRVYDVSNIANQPPQLLAGAPGDNTHSAWVTDDGRFLAVGEERDGGGVLLYEVIEEDGGVQLALRDSFSLPGDLAFSTHNQIIVGDRIYSSWYEAGLQVLEIDRTTQTMSLVASYDTSELEGLAWGVFPLLGLDRILVSDKDYGVSVISVIPLGCLTGSDCNANGTDDCFDILVGDAEDCNGNGIPDNCDLDDGGSADCNANGEPDECDLVAQHVGEFASPLSFPAGAGPVKVLAVDVDADGSMDLAVTNPGADTVSILFNNGSDELDNWAGLSEPIAVKVGASPVALTAGDLDGDGDLDLATANSASSDVTLLLNGGDGKFTSVKGPAVGSSPRSIAAGDFDGDGDLDLAVANQGDNSISILFNLGNAVYVLSAAVASGSGPTQVIVDDFDSDGDLDLAVANIFSNDVLLLINDGSGTFAPGDLLGVGDVPGSLASGDLDGDGDLDLVTANESSNDVSVLLNQGDGSFAQAVQIWTSPSPRSVVTADLDQDGDLDLALTNLDVGMVSILWNDGSGSFPTRLEIEVGIVPTAVAAAAMDDDAFFDLVVMAGGVVNILLSEGSDAASDDCNANQTPDECDIQSGESQDDDGDGVPDECATCDGDANGDGTVDPLDSGFVLARFGCPVGTGDPDCDAADQNGDGA
ncbi:MAG: VCBS repeat-containing protein, partial [Planctomycetes bacterium]|nr:VCBS repeat-containing protein [Planctomycetota bacterium]